MLDPEIKREFDRLEQRIRALEQGAKRAIDRFEVEQIADKAVDSIRPELAALKRRSP